MLFKLIYRLAAVGSAQRIAGIDPNELIPVIQKAQQNICIFAARTASTCATLLRISGLQSRESLSSSGYTELSIFVPSRSFKKIYLFVGCGLHGLEFLIIFHTVSARPVVLSRGFVEFIVIEHELAVDKHFLYAERLRLIGRCVLRLVLIEHGKIGEISGLYISAVFEHESVGGRAGHAADGVGQSVARTSERIAQELRIAVIDSRVLNAEILDPASVM